MSAARALAVVAALVGLAPTLDAQTDSVTVVAGEEYAAGSLHRSLLGNSYRDVWATPVRVPLLDLSEFAGGLTPARRGGGNQTTSLRFLGADGREYNFRSVNKDVTGALPADLQETVVDWTLQDQISSLHPGATLVASPLLDAAGVLHARPRLFVLPDDPRLGEFREEYARMLGTISVQPDEGENDTPDFADAERVAGTETFFEHLEESAEHQVNARAFLAARLMDLFFGDWDRHEDQWRWARFDSAGIHLWKPVPEDQDYVFVDYDGALIGVARGSVAKAVRFDTGISDLGGLTINSRALDRWLLSELPRAVWDSVAVDLQRRLSDRVIEDALRELPPAWHARSAAEIARVLRARRAALPDVARRLYEQLAVVPEIRGTDERDRLEVVRMADGSVQVRLYALEGDAQSERPYFERRFDSDETEEVRIDLHGGDDQAVVRGLGGRGIMVRVIGGGDDDVLQTVEQGSGSRTAFYDARGDNRFVTLPGTTVDRRPYEEPVWERGGFAAPPRSWGRSMSWFNPWAGWKSNVGVVVGGGPTLTRYGFRQDPYAYRIAVRGEYAPSIGGFAVQATGDFRRPNSPVRAEVLARLSDLQVVRFHGFGNETRDDADEDLYRVRETELRLEPSLAFPVADDVWLAAGPRLRYTDPEIDAAAPAATVLGSESFGQIGAEATLLTERRDDADFPQHGWTAEVGASGYPGLWGLDEAYGRTHAVASVYLTPPSGPQPTLALRAGGSKAWGDFPFQDAAFVGGSATLRGYPSQRFAGDAAAYGNASLRVPVTRAKLLVRGDLGVLALTDVGRVWTDGESSDTWHTAVGGGVWFSVLDRSNTVTALYAHGEEHRIYLQLGFPF